MKKILFFLMFTPAISMALVNPPWEEFNGPYDTWATNQTMTRLAVPHGWLVYVRAKGGVTFVPDEQHEWTLDANLTRSFVDKENSR